MSFTQNYLQARKKQGDMYFQLSDDVALNYIIGVHDSPEKERQYYIEILEKILRVSVLFINFTNDLFDEYIQRKYWKIEERK
jgi:hypothetical protein